MMNKIVFLIAMMVSCNSFAVINQPKAVIDEVNRVCGELGAIANKSLGAETLPPQEVMNAVFFCQGVMVSGMPTMLEQLKYFAERAKKASDKAK